MTPRIGVKICGVNAPDAFDVAADAGADWVGFVFFPRSPRAVTSAQAAALSARRDGGPRRVGLFVEPSDAEVADVLAKMPLDVLQVYAAPERVRALRQSFGIPVWRALGVASAEDLPLGLDGADGLVIEAPPPAGADRPGGHASQLDWSICAGWHAPGTWLLAGGLTPENVMVAIGQSGAVAVDVSSGVESAPGRKQPDLIRAFVAGAQRRPGLMSRSGAAVSAAGAVAAPR